MPGQLALWCPVIRAWDTLGHHETSTGDTKDCHLSHLSANVFSTKNYNIVNNNTNIDQALCHLPKDL